MKFFSFGSDATKGAAHPEIPLEIRQAVHVMGVSAEKKGEDMTEKAAPAAAQDSSRKESPFLSETADMEAVAKTPTVEAKPASLAPVWNPPVAPELKPLFDDSKQIKMRQVNRKIPWLLFGGVVLLGVVAVAAWFFLKKDPSSQVEVPTTPETTAPQAELVITPESPFSLETANYLSVDTESVTPASFKALLKQYSDQIVNAKITRPVEFLLTDKNNNPIAFSRFAYLMKLNLDPDFLTSLGESFSLFLYSNNGTVSLGLDLSFASAASDPFRSQKEALLPAAFQPLLFDGMTIAKNITFRSGTYNTQAVRYVNIDSGKNISFDYALRGTHWFIGNSKDTLRALLDK